MAVTDGWGVIDTDYPTGTWDDAVNDILAILVPLLINALADMTPDALQELGVDATKVVHASGESFIFHDGSPARVQMGGNAWAVALACLALLSRDGVSHRGMHWCRTCAKCMDAGVSA